MFDNVRVGVGIFKFNPPDLIVLERGVNIIVYDKLGLVTPEVTGDINETTMLYIFGVVPTVVDKDVIIADATDCK
jgi:hypothetical protein